MHHEVGLVRSLLALGMALTLCAVARAGDRDEHRPNFIVILCDNLGYGDLGCFGSDRHRTPRIDALAESGRRFTNFYVTSGVCTPSRASLMTGCYPRRVNLHISDRGRSVLQPVAAKGLHPDEVTLAEVLGGEGYATALIGKWHLGDQPAFLPTRQGFDEYFGIPYSDDMTEREGQPWPPLPLLRDETVIEAPADRNTLTRRYTDEAIRFIESHRDGPFFLCLAHAMPGSTQAPFASDDFRGRSPHGPYADAVEELDWSTGAIVDALARLGLDERTLIVWTSDNGAPRRDPPQGSNLPLGGWGYTTSEGGMRVPCIVRWSGHVPPGSTCDALATTMDLLPTFARLAGASLPSDRTIDGHDLRPLLAAEAGPSSAYEAFFYYHLAQLQAVRSDRWKLWLPRTDWDAEATAVDLRDDSHVALYDVVADPGETRDVAREHPAVVDRLLRLAQRAREDLGDGQHPGADQRPAGWVDSPRPLVRSE